MLEKIATVVGANGFVGKATVQELLNSGYEVYALTHVNTSEPIKSKHVHYLNLDLNDIESIVNKIGHSDYLYNFVWAGMKGTAMGNYELQLNNIQISLNMVKLCKLLGSKYVFAGSLIEYECINNLYKETENPGRTHIYGAAKICAHMFSKYECNKENVEYVCGLITNAYGPAERNPRLITTIINKVLKNEKVELSEGSQNYDFIYVSDVALAFRLIAEKGQYNKTYTIGSGNPKPLRDWLSTVNKIIAPDRKFEYGTARVCVDHLPIEMFSNELLKKDTGFYPRVSFENGILNTMNYWKNQQV